MDTLYFKVAEEYFSITAPDVEALKALIPSYSPFHVKPVADGLILRAEIQDAAIGLDPVGEELGQFDCGGTNHAVYRTADGYKFVISTPGGTPAVAMTANADFSHCQMSLYGTQSDRRFGLGNAMMIAYAFAVAYHGILLMHSSVTMQGGKGYLFLGKSGTGKSTHSGLWLKYVDGSDLLNDDNPAVKLKADGTAEVYGTPWSGKTPCYRNLHVPCGAFVRLEQYPENIIRRESLLEAFASILSSCSLMIWDKPSYERLVRTVEGVVKAVPVYYLRCRADEEAARLSHATITRPE